MRNIEADGFAFESAALGAEAAQELLTALKSLSGAGCRGLLRLPLVAEVARSEPLLKLARPHMREEPFPVHAIFFQKSAAANWLVPWHQDLTVALRSRVDVPGFGPWTIKDGVPHVQPPIELLQEMLTVRLHLDDADEANGALRVVPGSHCFGRLSPDGIRYLRTQQSEVICSVARGDALLMRPLLLHASGRCTTARPRRVLHIEYAGAALPGGLGWHEAA